MSDPAGPSIVILDQDRAYGTQLATVLRRCLRARTTAAANPGKAQALVQGDRSWDLVILADDFPLTPDLKQNLASRPRIRKVRQSHLATSDDIYPGLHTREIEQRIHHALEASAPGGISARPVIFVYGFSERRRWQWLDAFIRQQSRSGRPLYYFPFAPTYQVSLPLVYSPGPELSSLLLLLSTGANADYQGLGPCFERQKGPYYALRMGGFAEDIICSDLVIQEKVCQLFKQFIRSREEPSIGLVEVAGVPLRRLPKLLRQADVLVAEQPRGSSFAARCGYQEIQRLLHSCPPQLHILDLNPYTLRSNAYV